MAEPKEPQPGDYADPHSYMQAVAQYRHDQQVALEIKSESHRAEVNDFLLGLTPRNLFLLRSLIHSCIGDKQYASYMSGRLGAILEHVHHVDPDNGLPHGSDLFGEQQP